MNRRLPVVGIPCDHRKLGAHPFHAVGEKYVAAVREGSEALPLLIPVLDPPLPNEDLLSEVDGLLFTGSPSNVSPKHYGGESPREGVLQDERRDQTTLPLLKAAIEQGVPVLCLCRGFQELNVAFGGTLHQHVHEVEGRSDHREDKDAPLDAQYGPAHDVTVLEGGLLAKIIRERAFRVNSLHGQGIDRLAPRLYPDASAPDGQIEAVSLPDASAFVLGVQWHPEWRWSENPVSRQLLGAFGEALRKRLAIRTPKSRKASAARARGLVASKAS
jgi:putative glutamine amidotransferase